MRAVALAIVLLVPGIVPAQAVDAKTTAALQKLHRSAETAYTKRDLKFFENFLATEYTLVRPGSSDVKRPAALARLRETFRDTRLVKVTLQLKNLTKAGGQITALREMSFSGSTTGARPQPINQRSTSRVTFVQRNGRWQMVRQVVVGVAGVRQNPGPRFRAGMAQPAK